MAQVAERRKDDNLNPTEGKTPLRINGIKAAEFIRHIKGWIEMAERDALDARKAPK